MKTKKIKVRYESVDGYWETRSYKTLKSAHKWAVEMIGPPDIGNGYAVSYDGVGKIVVDGCTLEELFNGPQGKDSGKCPVCGPFQDEIGEPGWVIEGRPIYAGGELIDVAQSVVHCPMCNPPGKFTIAYAEEEFCGPIMLEEWEIPF